MELSLYLHAPFCTKKCGYCHFYVLPDIETLKEEWLEAICLEIDRYQEIVGSSTLRSIYFGGGTPSLLGPKRIEKVLQKLQSITHATLSDLEVTLEVNPEKLTLNLIENFKEAGINRISMGVQSFSNALLERLGRTHDSDKAKEAVYIINRAGITNLSIDLIYDLPHQTFNDWKESVEIAATLPITHLSLYNLTIEPHTRFFKEKDKITPYLPSEEESLQFYLFAQKHLQEAGLVQYEISAFAKKGFHSVHNSGYWMGRDFIGLGPSAFSYYQKKRFSNIANQNKYCKLLKQGNSPIDFEEQLEEEAALRESLVLQLRLISGVELALFPATFIEKQKPLFKELEAKGLLHLTSSTLSLTTLGILHYDLVAAELI